MNKDIEFPKVKNISVVITPPTQPDDSLWTVYLLNTGDESVQNVMVSSTGYGTQDEEEQKTGTLRYFYDRIDGQQFVSVELIDPAVFHLTNEYWVSFWLNDQLYDKRYVFVPDSIIEENLTALPLLNQRGILHE